MPESARQVDKAQPSLPGLATVPLADPAVPAGLIPDAPDCAVSIL